MIDPLARESQDETIDPRRWDRFGVGLSALCMVHCLGLPVVALLTPALALPESHAFHIGLLALVAPIALIALALGFRRHRAWGPVSIGAVGLGLLILAVSPGLPGLAEKGLTLLGGLFLVTAHLLNSRLASCGTMGFPFFERRSTCLAERVGD